jgi:hypothetical protein
MATLTLKGDVSGAVNLVVPPAAGTNTVTIPASTGTVMLSSNAYTWPAGYGTNGQVLTTNGSGTLSWTTAGGTTTISDTPPGSPSAGQMWWESDSGILYIYYNDGTTSQWVQASPSAGGNVIAGTTSGTITLAAPAVAGTNTATFPAKTGNVMIDGPAFLAYQSVSQSFPQNIGTKVLFDGESFDTNNNFASSRFTPTVAGYYQINSAVGFGLMTTANCYMTIAVYLNGSPYLFGSQIFGNTANASVINLSAIVPMNGTTDYVEIYCFQSQPANLVTIPTGNNVVWFSGSLIRGA